MGADALKEINESLINVYEKKTGLSREEIQDLMDNDTYMSPKKAIEKGFINGFMPDMDTKDGKEGTVINAAASAAGMFNSFAYAIPEDKAALLKKVIMDTGNNAAGNNQVPAAKENKEGENKMTLEEAMAKNPELKEELDSLLKEAEAKGVKGERNRLKELDAISASVAQEALNNAKYGEKPLDAKEFAYQAMLDDKIKMSAYMQDAVSDAEEAGVNNVGILPEGSEVSNEADELAAYANKRKEV